MNILRRYIRQILLEGLGTVNVPDVGKTSVKDYKSSMDSSLAAGKPGIKQVTSPAVEDNGDKENLLTEPDEIEDGDSQEEVNAISTGGAAMASSGAIRGVTTPLGTDSTYPSKKKKKKKKASKKGDSNWYKATTN
tara:strand:+ start:4982 stop:5386 length:405 start_codon:yes stop_codon:yes gene_type:complete